MLLYRHAMPYARGQIVTPLLELHLISIITLIFIFVRDFSTTLALVFVARRIGEWGMFANSDWHIEAA